MVFGEDPPRHPNCKPGFIVVLGKNGGLEVERVGSRPTCDRCLNREPHGPKVFPIRPETLCAPCKKIMKLLEHIGDES